MGRQRAADTAAIEQRLAAIVGQPHVILTSSGRSAIYYLLRAAGIGQGDEVIIQAFTCLAVPAAVKWAGATPIYADIQPATLNLDPDAVACKITSRTKAIIIQHTFGLSAPLADIVRLARRHHLLIIEDCAHALGAAFHGQPAGSFSDAAVLSFGRDKVLSCVFGGAIAVRNSALAQRLRTAQAKLPPPPRWWVAQQLLHPLLLWYIVLPLYFLAGGLGKIKLVIWQKLRLLSLAVSPKEKQGDTPAFLFWRFAPNLAPLLTHQLAKLPRATSRRREITARYAAKLKYFSGQDPKKNLLATAPLLRYPLFVANNRTTLRAARHAKLLLGDWYTTPVAPSVTQAVSGYTPGSCPNAEWTAEHIINLPTYPRLTDEQVERVIAFINDQALLPNDH